MRGYCSVNRARHSVFRAVLARGICYYLGMSASKKVYYGIGLYREDWERIELLLDNREKKIQFIELALQHEFELREGKARHVSSLAA